MKEIEFKWESIGTDIYKSDDGKMGYGEVTSRAKVIDGWVVKTIFHNNIGNALSNMVFISDINHEWKVK